MQALGNRLSPAFTAAVAAAGDVAGAAEGLPVVVVVAVAAITLELSASTAIRKIIQKLVVVKSHTHYRLIILGYQLGVRFVCPSSVSV